MKKRNFDEIKQEFLNYGYKILNGETFKNSKTKFKVIDDEGYLYSCRIEDVRYGKPYRFAKYNPYVIENINTYLKSNGYKNKLLSTEYVATNKKLVFTCEQCGEPYEVCFNHFKNSHQTRCKQCNIQNHINSTMNNVNDIEKYYKSRGLTVLDISEYKNNTSKLSVINNKGYKGFVSYSSLKASNNIKIIDPSNPYTIYNMNKYIKNNDLDCKLLSTEYKNRDSKLSFSCSCGEEFETTWSSFVNNNKFRCRKCSNKISKYELMIKNYLDNNSIEYIMEYRFNDCRNKYPLPFDFAIIKNSKIYCIIECDGQQHYKPIQIGGASENKALEMYEERINNDNIKDLYCKEHNINLLRIAYLDFENGKYINSLNCMFKNY